MTEYKRNDENALRRFGAYEKAARQWCARHHVNPDETIQHGSAEFSDAGPGFYTSDLRYTQRWLFVARWLAELKQEHDETDEAIVLLREFPPE